jgi:hypothetical protein
MHRASRGERESEGPEPGVQIEHRTGPPDAAEDLLDEDRLGRLACLQKGARRIGDGDPRQHHPNRPALEDKDLFAGRTPDDAGEVAILCKPGERFESAEAWPFGGFDQEVDAAVGSGQSQLSRPARRHEVTPDKAQLVNETDKGGLEHRALRQIDEVVAKPLAEADPCRDPRIVRPRQAQPRAPPCRRDNLQRLHEARLDTDPFERAVKSAELECSIGSLVEMLQRAAAAMAEMPAGGFGAPAPGGQPLDNPAFAPAAAAGAEPDTYMVARHREGQKHRLAVMFGDPVAARADPLDEVVGVPLVPATRSRHHLAPLFSRGCSRATASRHGRRSRGQYGASILRMGSARRRGAAGSGRGPGDRRCAVVLDSGRCRRGERRLGNPVSVW